MIPAEQVVPWAIITLISFYLGNQILGLGNIETFLITVWGISTWWFLTANGYHHFFSRLMTEPNWVRAITYYEAIIDGEEDRGKES